MLDLYRPGKPLSLRKIGVLVNYLPPESATITAIRNSVTPEVAALSGEGTADPVKARWSMAEMLTATVIDELRGMRWLYISAHSDKPQGHPPEPLPRPGVASKPARRVLSNEERMRLDPRMRAVSGGDSDG